VAARQLLATLLHEAGQNDAAEAVLSAGVRASPEHVWFALSLAGMQAERGDMSAAVVTLHDGIERRTVDAEYRATLAALLLRLNRHADAARQYEQALGMAPGRGRWWMGLGLALEGEGKTAAARAAYSRAQLAGDLPEKLVDFVQSKLETR
ncbi:tetratricopeptide repeat protein, partial [Thiobacillus sp.]